MPDLTGTPSGDAGLTEQLTPKEEQPGKPDPETDLTEVVKGLTRTVTSLKKQLAEQAAKPDEDKDKELEILRREKTKFEKIVKYPDVSPVLKTLMDKPSFDPSVIDDEFVTLIRNATKPVPSNEDEGEAVVHNPQRLGGRPSQEQQDEQALKGLKSLFDI